jgi:hypothetical protein
LNSIISFGKPREQIPLGSPLRIFGSSSLLSRDRHFWLILTHLALFFYGMALFLVGDDFLSYENKSWNYRKEEFFSNLIKLSMKFGSWLYYVFSLTLFMPIPAIEALSTLFLGKFSFWLVDLVFWLYVMMLGLGFENTYAIIVNRKSSCVYTTHFLY